MKLTTILSTLAAATLVSAGEVHDFQSSVSNRVVPGGYIIEYEPNVTHTDAHDRLKAHEVEYKVRNEYNIFNGAAITVKSNHDGQSLASIPGVKNVWPIAVYSLPKSEKSKTKATDPEVISGHQLTGVDVLHKSYKLTGKGIKIGVIDSGIDYKHPAFAAKGATAGCFGKNCRVTHGWDFVGDDYTGSDSYELNPDADPMDCAGHGTHVAGIIGGNALNIQVSPKPPQPFVGVAPEATFGAYRVFGCDGSTGSDVVIAAMERAFKDGMDVINISIEGGSGYKLAPEAVLGEKLIARGMAIAAAAGDNGDDGVWMVSDIGLGDSSSSVASFDATYGRYHGFKYGAVSRPYSSSTAYGQPIDLTHRVIVPVFDDNGDLSDGCDSTIYDGIDVTDKIVLVLGDSSRCDAYARGENVLNTGAAGVLVQTTPYGIASLNGYPDVPMGAIEFQAGEDIIATYKKAPQTTVSFSKTEGDFYVEGGGSPSPFSSFGLDGDLRSKPDLGAPGGNILSTYPLAQGGYTVLSGTSMASPYIAGSHALYMEAKKSKPHGDVIRKALKNTATISKSYKSKTFASAAKQGSGLVNVLNAILTTTSISPDHIDLLDTAHFKKSVKIQIKNTGKHTQTYTLSHTPADALNSYPDNTFPLSTPIVEADYATVKFSSTKVKIAAGKTATVTLTFTEPKKGVSSQFPIYSGFVIATPSTKGGIPVHVPYTGMKGDVAKVPIMDRDENIPNIPGGNTGDSFPAMLALGGPDGVSRVSPGFSFRIANPISSKKSKDDSDYTPAVAIRLGSHTPDMTIRVFNASNGKFEGFLYGDSKGAFGMSGRNPTLFDGIPDVTVWFWNGQVVKTESASAKPNLLSSGTYTIVVAAQKKLSKGVYPADFEIYDLGSYHMTIV